MRSAPLLIASRNCLDLGLVSNEIQYPVACAMDGTAVHISAWTDVVAATGKREAVTCFGCAQPMVGRLPSNGIKPTAHFAHSAEGACHAETALHAAAKEAIVGAHRRGALRRLEWPCPWCNQWKHQTDLSDLELRVEDIPCEGVKSDVLGRDVAGVPRVAIEVFVTHDVEEKTLARYRAQDVSVFVLSLRRGYREPLSWGIVTDLALGVVDCLRVDRRLQVVDRASCVNCQRILREEAALVIELASQALMRRWRVFLEAWRSIGRAAVEIHEEHLRESDRVRTRIVEWWERWPRAWQRVGDEVRIDYDRETAWWKTWSSAWITTVHVAWWMAWSERWRESAVDYERFHAWWRKWSANWKGVVTYPRDWWQEWAASWKKIGEDVVAPLYVWWGGWSTTWTQLGEHWSKEERDGIGRAKFVKLALDLWIDVWKQLGERRRQAVIVMEALALVEHTRSTEALVLLQQAGDVLHSPCPACLAERGQLCIEFGTGGRSRSVPHEDRV